MSSEGTEVRLAQLAEDMADDGYVSPAYWCPACKTPDYVGVPENRCYSCGEEVVR